MALRTYLPQKVILDGTWFPPRIEKVIKRSCDAKNCFTHAELTGYNHVRK